MERININPSVRYAHYSFATNREYYAVRLKVEQAQDLVYMLYNCVNDPVNLNSENELELLVLTEILKSLEKKVYAKYKATLTLNRSQARTLFMWLNECSFPEHPLHESLAYEIVAQIDKQLPTNNKNRYA